MEKTHRFMTKNFGKYDIMSIASYESVGGFQALKRVVDQGAEATIEKVASCRIKGRGGAGYDIGTKWRQARGEKAPEKVVVCNADEGEPCTFKDRELIANDPFRLIEGMIIAGYCVNAQNGYIYMREEYSHLRPRLKNAIKQANEQGYLGKNILGKGFDYQIHLYTGAGAYVCGEGTALVESMEGKSGRPRMKPPYIKQCGLNSLPTCVNNVESLSLMPSIVLDDECEYLRFGTENSVGTKLVSVAGNVKNPGVFEIPFGITVREIIYDLAGGMKDDKDIRLIQFGGASGKVAGKNVLDTPYTYEDLTAAGVGVGSGAIFVMNTDMQVIDFLKVTQRFFLHESCGQCTPCREGNKHVGIILNKIANGEHTEEDIQHIHTLANIMKNASLCGLGETAQSATISAMSAFPEVFQVTKEVI